jgi:hypothetical protein
MRPRSSLFFPILSSTLIQALVLVSILAPSALTVAPSEQVSRDMAVPIFNLTSQAQFTEESPTYSNDTGYITLGSLGLSTIGAQRISSVLLNLPQLTWAIPQDCGLKCAFYFEYNAPGLECHDASRSGEFLPFEIYQADTNLYPPWNATASPRQQVGIDPPYDLSITYKVVNSLLRYASAPTGTYCRFYQATYNVSLELNRNSGTQQASTSIISHGDYLSWGKITTTMDSSDDYLEGIASWAICYAFAVAFKGYHVAGMSGITKSQPALKSMFKIDESNDSFELAVSNLSQGLVDLFSNLTLGLILTRGGPNTIIANGTIWDGSSIWIYTTWVLWVAYIPALMLAIIVARYGLYAIHVNEIAMDDKFSTFLLATRNADLDKMCREAADFEELERIQLIHQKRGTFLVVDSGLDSAN